MVLGTEIQSWAWKARGNNWFYNFTGPLAAEPVWLPSPCASTPGAHVAAEPVCIHPRLGLGSCLHPHRWVLGLVCGLCVGSWSPSAPPFVVSEKYYYQPGPT